VTSEAPGLALRCVGGLVVALVTAVVSLVEVFWVVTRVGTLRLPVSIAIAVVAHPLLTRWMRGVTASRPAALVPFAVWIAVVLPFGSPRAEGDLVLTGEWVSYAYLLLGTVAFIVAAVVLVQPRRRDR